MRYAAVDGILRLSLGHKSVDKSRSERIASAHAVEYLERIELHALIELTVRPADGAPIVDGSCLDGSERSRNHLEIRINLDGVLYHFAIAFDIELLESRVVTLDLKTETGGEVLLVAYHDVDIFCDFAVDLPSLFKSAYALPERGTVVEVIGDDGAVFLGLFDCGYNGLCARLGESGKDSARVQPADSQFAENIIPVNILGPELRGGSVAPVGHADGSAYTVAALGKVEPVSDISADAVIAHPFYK